MGALHAERWKKSDKKKVFSVRLRIYCYFDFRLFVQLIKQIQNENKNEMTISKSNESKTPMILFWGEWRKMISQFLYVETTPKSEISFFGSCFNIFLEFYYFSMIKSLVSFRFILFRFSFKIYFISFSKRFFMSRWITFIGLMASFFPPNSLSIYISLYIYMYISLWKGLKMSHCLDVSMHRKLNTLHTMLSRRWSL